MRAALIAQDCLSTVIMLDLSGNSACTIGSMVDLIEVQHDKYNKPIAAMSRPEIRIDSVTVTEGGYFLDPATGRFDSTDPIVLAAVHDPDRPRMAFGAMLASLGRGGRKGYLPLLFYRTRRHPL